MNVKRLTSLLLILPASLIVSCYQYDADVVYEDVNRMITPSGKILNCAVQFTDLSMTFPPGAVSENTLVGFPLILHHSDLAEKPLDYNMIPNVIIDEQDRILGYRRMIDFRPNDMTFQHPVEVELIVPDFSSDHPRLFKFKGDGNPKDPANWSAQNEPEEWADIEIPGYARTTFSITEFGRYILCDGTYDDRIYINNHHKNYYAEAASPPMYVASLDRYVAWINDVNPRFSSKYFVIYIYYVNAPQNNKSYQVYNGTSGFGNTSDDFVEVAVGFDCPAGGTSDGCEVFRSRSGSIKYFVDDHFGSLTPKLLFNNVVVGNSEGDTHVLNGYYWLW